MRAQHGSAVVVGYRISILVPMAFLLLIPAPLPAMATAGQAQKSVDVVVHQIETTSYPQIKAYVSVLLNTRDPVLGLSRESFFLTEDNVAIPRFTVSPLPREEESAIVLAIDVSGSMLQEARLEKAKAAATAFVSTLSPQDRCAILAFNDSLMLVSDFAQEKGVLSRAINGLTACLNTRLYDAIFEGIQLLSRSPAGRRTLIVLTDGKDEGSILRDEDCIQEALRQPTPVYAITVGSLDISTRQPLARIAKLTGGGYFHAANPDFLRSVYADIGRRLRSQYVLEYESTVPADGSWHQFRVDVADKNYEGFAIRSFSIPAFRTRIVWYHVLLAVVGILFLLAIVASIVLAIQKYFETRRLGKRPGWATDSLAHTRVHGEAGGIPAQANALSPELQATRQLMETKEATSSKTLVLPRRMPTPNWRLRIRNPAGDTRCATLRSKLTSIGSATDNDVVLTGETVAEYHAVLFNNKNKFLLLDLGSRSGTMVRKKRVHRRVLREGEEVAIGEWVMQLELANDDMTSCG